MSTINKNQNKVTDLQTSLKIMAFFLLLEVAITGTGGLTGHAHVLHKRPKKKQKKKSIFFRSINISFYPFQPLWSYNLACFQIK